MIEKLPLIKLSDDYKNLIDYSKAFEIGIPNITDLESLEVNKFRIFTEKELKGRVKF